MEKLVYLLRDAEERPGSEIRRELIEEAAPRLRAAGAHDITFDVQDEDVAAGRPLRRDGLPIRAMACFWLQVAEDGARTCEQALAAHVSGCTGFLVVESRPLVHEAPRGRRTPGMNQVTCLARRPDLDYDEFLRIWQTDHRKVAVETQSTVGYVRNVIVRPLTETAPAWDAIVEETFPIEALSDPRVFYAAESDEALEHNLDRMITSCKRFLDFESMEMLHTSEYYLG